MYKKLSIQELTSIKTNFFSHIDKILKKEQCHSLKDVCKKIFKWGDSVYYYNKGILEFVIHKKNDVYELIDTLDAIYVHIQGNQLLLLSNIIQQSYKNGNSSEKKQDIQDILRSALQQGYIDKIQNKPYIVYDIETDGMHSDVSKQKFIMAYTAYIDENKNVHYEYRDEKSSSQLLQRLVEFNGYVIGFNILGFDNPVIIHNCNASEDIKEKLQQKSIDIFCYLFHQTGKKLSLNKLTQSLLGERKTLESGIEASMLYNDYVQTGDVKLLETVKEYCKNDVRLTLLLLLYFLHYQKIHIDNKEIRITIQDLVHKSNLPLYTADTPSDTHRQTPQNQALW